MWGALQKAKMLIFPAKTQIHSTGKNIPNPRFTADYDLG